MISIPKGTLWGVQQLGSLTKERSFIFRLKGLKLATQLGNLLVLGHSSIFISETDLPECISNYQPYQR